MKAEEILTLLEFKLPNGKTIEEIEVKDLKEHFDKSFVGINVAAENETIKNKILGKERGSLATQVKNKFEEMGISFEGKEVKDGERLMLDKVLNIGFTESLNTVKTLKEAANHTDDTKLKEVQKKLDKLQTDYSTVLSERNTLNETLKTKDSEFEGFKTRTIIDSKIKTAKDKIPFSETWNEFAKTGFDKAFFDKYQIELSDTNDSGDGLRIINKATNTRVSKGNSFITLEELYKQELSDAKGLKLNNNQNNNNGGGSKPGFVFNKEGKEIKINPLAAKIAAGEKI